MVTGSNAMDVSPNEIKHVETVCENLEIKHLVSAHRHNTHTCMCVLVRIRALMYAHIVAVCFRYEYTCIL